MSSIVCVSEAASIAIHATIFMARRENLVQAHEIAAVFDASEAHLSKVLQRLVKTGIVRADRGRNGGYRLAKKSDEIFLIDVYEAIEGPLDMSGCILSPGVNNSMCPLGEYLIKVNELTRKYFTETSLASFLVSTTCGRVVRGSKNAA